MTRTKTLITGFVLGYVLAHLVFVGLALVIAIPGLGVLHRGIKAAGLSPQLFTVLVHYLPMVLTAFAVGRLVFRVIGGFRPALFVALAVPWLLMGGYTCLVVADDGLLDCWRYSEGNAFVLDFALVPLGLLLAGLGLRPLGPNMAVQTEERPDRALRFLGRRSPLR